MQIFHILICNLHNRNIIDIDLVFVNQVKQKIQRAFKYIQLNR